MAKTPWQRHASRVMKAGGSLQDASATWDKKTNKPKGTFKPKAKSRARTKSTRTTRKPTVSSRPASRNTSKRTRPKGKLERKKIAFKKEFDDIARALGVPLSKTTFKIVKNSWVLKAGKVKAKRVKLGDAMREFRKRARKRL